MAQLKVGDRIPDAVVYEQENEPRRIAEFAGSPFILLFFPFAFSPLCTEEICIFAEDYSAWTADGVRVVALSPDSPHANQRFARECGATFPILSDWNREAVRAFGLLCPDAGGLRDASERAAYVIDAEGIVRFAWVGEHPGKMVPFTELRAAVRALGRPAE